MGQSSKAQDILSQVSGSTPQRMGGLKAIAKEIKKDHQLAMELWASREYYARLVSVLIMDKKLLTQAVIDTLAKDMQTHEYDQRNQLADWFMANQLAKDKTTTALMGTWEHAGSATLRRIFWYHQGRLRWTGQVPPPNTPGLLTSLEADMSGAEPEVQWAMNFAAAQIGIFEPESRERCIALGKRLGLYADLRAPRGCTPLYLPEWIRVEVGKRGK